MPLEFGGKWRTECLRALCTMSSYPAVRGIHRKTDFVLFIFLFLMLFDIEYLDIDMK